MDVESKNIARTTIRDDPYVDFEKAHKPLLSISETENHPIPIALSQKNFDPCKDKNRKKEFKVFTGELLASVIRKIEQKWQTILNNRKSI